MSALKGLDINNDNCGTIVGQFADKICCIIWLDSYLPVRVVAMNHQFWWNARFPSLVVGLPITLIKLKCMYRHSTSISRYIRQQPLQTVLAKPKQRLEVMSTTFGIITCVLIAETRRSCCDVRSGSRTDSSLVTAHPSRIERSYGHKASIHMTHRSRCGVICMYAYVLQGSKGS